MYLKLKKKILKNFVSVCRNIRWCVNEKILKKKKKKDRDALLSCLYIEVFCILL